MDYGVKMMTERGVIMCSWEEVRKVGQGTDTRIAA